MSHHLSLFLSKCYLWSIFPAPVQWNRELLGYNVSPNPVFDTDVSICPCHKRLLLTCSSFPKKQGRQRRHVPWHTEETTESETTPPSSAVASNWSGIRLRNCTFLSCWACSDCETKEDYSASSRHPHLEGSLVVRKKKRLKKDRKKKNPPIQTLWLQPYSLQK